MGRDPQRFDVSIIVVSYNTATMTLACLQSIYARRTSVAFELIVLDNASTDGSADAIANQFPQARLIRLSENVGFAAGNNLAVQSARGAYVLFLNPDTEVLDGAIDNLFSYALAHPQAGAWGGRTVFADGRLNASSVRAFTSLRGLFFSALGLSAALKSSPFFNPDPYPGFERDHERQVDVLFFCFVLMRRDVWDELGGFNLRYFMFCEDDDLCLRLARSGRPARFTPEAVIVHHGGASIPRSADRAIAIMKARLTYVELHWAAPARTLAKTLLQLGILVRVAGTSLVPGGRTAMWREVLRRRGEWIGGYPKRAAAEDVSLAGQSAT